MGAEMTIRAIVFDIGGVLEFTPDLGVTVTWEKRLNLPPGDMNKRLSPMWCAGNVGTISLGDVHQRIGETLGIDEAQVNALMADVAANMEYQIKRACAQVENESLPSCLGDASKISRIFTNLLANALKFLDKSRPGLIRISGKSQDGESIYCV